jgi:hypothetical protein
MMAAVGLENFQTSVWFESLGQQSVSNSVFWDLCERMHRHVPCSSGSVTGCYVALCCDDIVTHPRTADDMVHMKHTAAVAGPIVGGPLPSVIDTASAVFSRRCSALECH